MQKARRPSQVILKHLTRWKSLYEVIGVALAVGISAISLLYTQQAINIQSKEFFIRNRPYITITDPTFSGKQTTADGNVCSNTILCEIRNISDVPATAIETKAAILLNGKEVSTSIMSQTSLTRDVGKTATIFINDNVYAQALNPQNKLEIRIVITYLGMLPNEPQYETVFMTRYYQAEGLFKSSELQIK